MQSNKVDILRLSTIKNYADRAGVTTSYIYKLVKEQRIEAVDIDGVKFVDKIKYPAIPGKK